LNFSDFHCSAWNIYENIRQGWRTFLRALAQISYKIQRSFFSHALGNFEEKTKALDSSTIIIDYYITINAFYN